LNVIIVAQIAINVAHPLARVFKSGDKLDTLQRNEHGARTSDKHTHRGETSLQVGLVRAPPHS
jgi:hypothetical protein